LRIGLSAVWAGRGCSTYRFPKSRGSNLAAPLADGRERSNNETGRRVSVYAIGQRHTLALTAAGAALALATFLGRRRKTLH